LLRGDSLITNCPALNDLGAGLKCMIGDLTITNCPRLQRLPDGFETMPLTGTILDPGGFEGILGPYGGNLILENCPNLSWFGKDTKVRGYIVEKGCPNLPRKDPGACV
jgi:hypothetical protein